MTNIQTYLTTDDDSASALADIAALVNDSQDQGLTILTDDELEAIDSSIDGGLFEAPVEYEPGYWVQWDMGDYGPFSSRGEAKAFQGLHRMRGSSIDRY